MEGILDFVIQYWPYVIAGIPVLASIFGKCGLIGKAVIRAIRATADGDYSDKEKVETMNDIIAIGKSWWFNRSKI